MLQFHGCTSFLLLLQFNPRSNHKTFWKKKFVWLLHWRLSTTFINYPIIWKLKFAVGVNFVFWLPEMWFKIFLNEEVTGFKYANIEISEITLIKISGIVFLVIRFVLYSPSKTSYQNGVHTFANNNFIYFFYFSDFTNNIRIQIRKGYLNK